MQLSILIVNWNTGAVLMQCLHSLRVQALPEDWEIIVMDNASQDDSVEILRSQFPNVLLQASTENIGYARGNNLAAAQAQGRYLLLLNPDTIASQETLAALLAFMEEHPHIGACSPRLLLSDGSPQPYAFGADPRPGYLLRRGWNRLVHHRSLHDWAIDTPQVVDWVSGACLLVRRQAWEQVGGFDEAFFMYFEDIDLCLRIRHAGWQIMYNPRVEITHLGGRSLRQNPDAQRAYRQSLHHFYRKHYGLPARLFLTLALPLYARVS
ncbi:MAG: glycosyltransferase family 2 protein [Chloroflexi bacterium]|nr:glycosyltransferase family 2 protein [Chloroflexota bacterium]